MMSVPTGFEGSTPLGLPATHEVPGLIPTSVPGGPTSGHGTSCTIHFSAPMQGLRMGEDVTEPVGRPPLSALFGAPIFVANPIFPGVMVPSGFNRPLCPTTISPPQQPRRHSYEENGWRVVARPSPKPTASPPGSIMTAQASNVLSGENAPVARRVTENLSRLSQRNEALYPFRPSRRPIPKVRPIQARDPLETTAVEIVAQVSAVPSAGSLEPVHPAVVVSPVPATPAGINPVSAGGLIASSSSSAGPIPVGVPKGAAVKPKPKAKPTPAKPAAPLGPAPAPETEAESGVAEPASAPPPLLTAHPLVTEANEWLLPMLALVGMESRWFWDPLRLALGKRTPADGRRVFLRSRLEPVMAPLSSVVSSISGSAVPRDVAPVQLQAFAPIGRPAMPAYNLVVNAGIGVGNHFRRRFVDYPTLGVPRRQVAIGMRQVREYGPFRIVNPGTIPVHTAGSWTNSQYWLCGANLGTGDVEVLPKFDIAKMPLAWNGHRFAEGFFFMGRVPPPRWSELQQFRPREPVLWYQGDQAQYSLHRGEPHEAYSVQSGSFFSKLRAEGQLFPYLRKAAIVFADCIKTNVVVRPGDMLYTRKSPNTGPRSFDAGGVDLKRLGAVRTAAGTYPFELLGETDEYCWGILSGKREVGFGGLFCRGECVKDYLFTAEEQDLFYRFYVNVSTRVLPVEDRVRLLFNKMAAGVPPANSAAINDVRNAWVREKAFPSLDEARAIMEMVAVGAAWVQMRPGLPAQVA